MELVHSVYRTASSRTVRSTRPQTASGSLAPNGAPVPNGGVAPNGGADESRDVFHVSFDPDAESVTEVVTEAVAVIHNDEADELDPLHGAVDVDALDELVAPTDDDRPGADEVQFVYEGLEVVVAADGNVWLQWE